MHIAYVTSYPARDPLAFGGRGVPQAETVARLGTVSYLEPEGVGAHRLRHFGRRVACRLSGRAYYPTRDRATIIEQGRALAPAVERSGADVVVSPMSPGSQPVAALECRQPIVIWTDATLVGAMRLYRDLGPDRMCRRSIADGLANERAALDRARLVVYSSDWAARTAIEHYGIEPERTAVVPFGPAFAGGLNPEELTSALDARPTTVCRLLFIGLGWERKGGSIALAVARRLDASGVPVQLDLVGSPPPTGTEVPPYVTVHGRLDTATPRGRAELSGLMSGAHFLLLPTRADCTPLVISEAAACGLPTIATRVGGLATMVDDGHTGRLFGLDDDPVAYAGWIAEVFADTDRYRSIARAAYDDSRRRLSWDAAASSLAGLLAGVLSDA